MMGMNSGNSGMGGGGYLGRPYIAGQRPPSNYTTQPITATPMQPGFGGGMPATPPQSYGMGNPNMGMSGDPNMGMGHSGMMNFAPPQNAGQMPPNLFNMYKNNMPNLFNMMQGRRRAF